MFFNKAFLFVLFIPFFGTAQKFELGKVSVAELEEKVCPSDSNAVAAILYNKARTHFVYEDKTGFSTVHEYEFRIKIYKKEGLSWANHKVRYYIGYENLRDETVAFSNCVTYNLENGAIVKTKLAGEGSFKKEINEYWKEAAITMPNVKPGSVIEFKYVLKSENIVRFPVFTFQYDIPVNYARYDTEIPEYFIYKPILQGFRQVNTESKIVSGHQNFSNQYNQTVNLSYQQINSSYFAEHIPALHDEAFVDNIENYRSSVHHELEKTRFHDAPEKNYATTWEGVANTIFKERDFGKQLDQHDYFLPDLKMIIKDAVTETEKANAIFNFVQHKMNWNGDYSYYADKGAKKAYEAGTGNAAEINFILIAMLNQAGLNANAVLTSTISHGVPVFPGRTIFNYVIASATVDGSRMLFDAVNKYTTPNILPFYALNWNGRLIRSDGSSEEINLVPKIVSKELVNIIGTIDASGKISGKCRSQKTNYNALHYREKYGNANQDGYVEKFENDHPGLQISKYLIENKVTDLSKPVVESFDFETNNETEVIGNRMMIDPLLFFTIAQNPFNQEQRELPIYLAYPEQIKYNISFEIPAGYTVESVPKSITFAMPENVGTFAFKILTAENKIQVAVTTDMNNVILPADFYPTLKEFYQKSIDRQNEKIILKKI